MKNIDNRIAMKKRIVTIMAALFLAVTPMMSQVFIMEDDDAMNVRDPEGSIVFNVMVPTQDTNTEQFIPIGGGALLLAGLGGAYLLCKRRKEE
jgi:hypothetical protein